MDMLEFLRTRRTYRRFEQRPVAPEILTSASHVALARSLTPSRRPSRRK